MLLLVISLNLWVIELFTKRWEITIILNISYYLPSSATKYICMNVFWILLTGACFQLASISFFDLKRFAAFHNTALCQ